MNLMEAFCGTPTASRLLRGEGSEERKSNSMGGGSFGAHHQGREITGSTLERETERAKMKMKYGTESRTRNNQLHLASPDKNLKKKR